MQSVTAQSGWMHCGQIACVRMVCQSRITFTGTYVSRSSNMPSKNKKRVEVHLTFIPASHLRVLFADELAMFPSIPTNGIHNDFAPIEGPADVSSSSPAANELCATTEYGTRHPCKGNGAKHVYAERQRSLPQHK